MKEVFVRSYNNYDGDERSLDTAYVEDMPSLAIQSQRDEADINNIVRMFGVTGKIPESVRVPTYGDFSMVEDYQTAIHAIREAEASFMQMPADTRARFENDPQQFLEFCENPNNLEEMRKLGLAVPAAIVAEAKTPEG
ncbi:MAG: internal scaffolding protein [Microvirus sp.]|nr:MAG: internal scaffolding protein [Microvirus sp.]